MDDIDERRFLEKLCESNRQFYSDERGRGVLRDLQQTFLHPWHYLAELLQNAVDEGAGLIRICTEGTSTLVFEHDGNEFTQANVQALCRRGVSTKGAGSLGFMGIGFKSVFHSFQRVEVASGRWRFRLEVPVSLGEYKQRQRDWLNCVLPRCADDIRPPSDGMTCCFVLANRVPDLTSVQEDLARLFPEDPLILPLLARRGVKRLECDGRTWLLNQAQEVELEQGLCRAVVEARDEMGGDPRRWVLFSAGYVPSPGAIRRLLEHRQLGSAEKERAEAERERQVEVFCPLDDAGVPVPPTRGQAFALLPTGVEFPIGLHVQADWLLATNREQILQIADNPWHQDICARIPALLAAFLRWVRWLRDIPVEQLPEVYSVLPDLAEARGEQGAWVERPEFLDTLRRQLGRLPFLPARTPQGVAFVSPETGYVLPEPLRVLDKAELLPWDLFGSAVVSTRLLGRRAEECLKNLGLLRELLPTELAARWEDGTVGEWHRGLGDQSQQALLRLLEALAKLDEREDWRQAPLRCLPSRAGGWIARGGALGLPPDWDSVPKENPEIQIWLEPCLPPAERTLDWEFERACQRHEGAQKYVEEVPRAKLDDILSEWWESLPESPSEKQVGQVLELTSWVRAKMRQRPGLVKKVLSEAGDHLTLLPLDRAVLADPYATRARRRFFPGLAVVSDRYLRRDPGTTDADWRSFFESLSPEVLGPLRLKQRTIVLSKSALEELVPGFRAPTTKTREIISEHWGQKFCSKSYLVADFFMPEELAQVLDSGPDHQAARDAEEWLREAGSSLRPKATARLAYVPYGVSWVSEQALPGPASWVQALTQWRWVFATDKTGPYPPSAVLPGPDPARPEAQVADLPPELVQTLVECGIQFGTEISDVPHLDRLRLEGPQATPERLRELIDKALTEAGEDADKRQRLREVLITTALFPPAESGARVPMGRLVRRAPRGSDLGGWLIALDELPEGHPLPGLVDLLKTIAEVPEVPTWDQALEYLRWVWKDQPDAETVRRVLPRAYAMIREDLESRPERQQRWDEARRRAAVFTRSRKWILLQRGEVFLDDLEEQRLERYLQGIELATPSHLGDAPDEQRCTAQLLGLPLLSGRYKVELRREGEQAAPPQWQEGLNQVCAFLERLAMEERDAETLKAPPALRRCVRLTKSLAGERVQSIWWEVQAACDNGEILVAGDPIDFMAELCTQLIAWAGLSARRDMERLAPQVSQLIALLDRPEKFVQLVTELHRQKGWEAPAAPEEPPRKPEPPAATPVPGIPPEPQVSPAPTPAPPGVLPGSEPPPPRPHTPEDREAMLRAARERYLAAKKEYAQCLAVGSLPPGPDGHETSEKEDGGPSDEPYRDAVLQYERDHGRFPVAKAREQPGHDIDSYSHPEGHPERRLLRRIEVKGKGRPWVDAETVELTNRQFADMLRSECEEPRAEDFDHWLYVVEPGREGGHSVLPVRNPARRTAKFELRGATWREEAEADASAP